jgi:hypothetical protein
MGLKMAGADTSESSDHVEMASALHPNRWMVSETDVSGRVVSVVEADYWFWIEELNLTRTLKGE